MKKEIEEIREEQYGFVTNYCIHYKDGTWEVKHMYSGTMAPYLKKREKTRVSIADEFRLVGEPLGDDEG